MGNRHTRVRENKWAKGEWDRGLAADREAPREFARPTRSLDPAPPRLPGRPVNPPWDDPVDPADDAPSEPTSPPTGMPEIAEIVRNRRGPFATKRGWT